MFEPVERTRAFERVVEQIEQAIYSGRLKPGDHLPAERALAEEFKVGRSSVREALRILESLGLLHTAPGSPLGPEVAASTATGLHRMLRGFVQMEDVSLADLVQYRMISGSAANLLAAHLRSHEHLARMASAISQMESTHPSDTRQFAEHDLKFHEAIADASRNSLLNVINGIINKLIVNLMADAIDRSSEPRRTRDDFLLLHRRLYTAIEQGDGELAAHLARSSLLDVYGPLLAEEDRTRLQLLMPDRERAESRSGDSRGASR